MQKDTGITAKGIVLLAISLISLGLCAPSAQATVRDPNVAYSLSTQRQRLMVKERQLLEDYDDLQRQINDLQKFDGDPREIDSLHHDLDSTYADLRSVRADLKAVEYKMM